MPLFLALAAFAGVAAGFGVNFLMEQPGAEQIVESMEAGETPLAELLAKFEEGNKLLKTCEARLKDAELKIEQLRKQKDGVAFEKLNPGA